MDGNAVKAIKDMATENITTERDGILFSGKDMHPVFYAPRPTPMELHTLSGLVQLINDNVDNMDAEKLVIIVESPDQVKLVSQFYGVDRKRDTLAIVTIDRELKQHEFGTYYSVESFVISLRSQFEHTEDLDRLINYVKNIRGGKSFELEDDGITQTATVQAGVHGALTEKESAPALVKLRPYRTFRDIEQTESEFIFRMKLMNAEQNIVGACLYEADGGRWRHFAAKAIQTYLQEALPNGPSVIA